MALQLDIATSTKWIRVKSLQSPSIVIHYAAPLIADLIWLCLCSEMSYTVEYFALCLQWWSARMRYLAVFLCCLHLFTIPRGALA